MAHDACGSGRDVGFGLTAPAILRRKLLLLGVEMNGFQVEARPSPDDQFHICRRQDGKGPIIRMHTKPACFWAPIGAAVTDLCRTPSMRFQPRYMKWVQRPPSAFPRRARNVTRS